MSTYLDGPFGPVADEVTVTDLAIHGELPTELDGRYVRNGPNPLTPPDPATHHWFLGDGMVHGIRLRDGRAAWYRNRYVGSPTLAAARGQADIPGPNWSASGLGPNTNVGGFAGRTWAVVEAGGCPVELTDELESVCRNDFFGTLEGGFTAHPKYDPASGELHAMCYAPAWLNTIRYIVVGADGLVRRTVEIPLPAMTMVHDMSLTARYAVVYDLPVKLDFDLLAAGRFPFSWQPDSGARLGLLPRSGTAQDIVWVDVPLCYAYHPLNAYDAADGSVVVDLCVYDRMFLDDLNGPFGDTLPRLERWTIDPVARTCSTAVVDAGPCEFPRHNDAVAGSPHRFGYAVRTDPGALAAGWPTVKVDLATGISQSFDHGPGRCAGELVFQSRPGATAEDDGWLLGFVHDIATATTDFVVIDAADLGRGYVARVHIPRRIPLGFHGNWIRATG